MLANSEDPDQTPQNAADQTSQIWVCIDAYVPKMWHQANMG